MTRLIATCAAWPDGNADLRALAQAIQADLKPWQDIRPADSRDTLILPLAAWDYSEQPARYRHWLHELHAHGAQLANSAALQNWNMDKRYLATLAKSGVDITPSLALLPDTSTTWAAAIAHSGWTNPVLKPLIGQSGRGVRRLADGAPTLADYPDGLLVQPFIDAPHGEICLIHIDGAYSHAAHRQPPRGEWRANSAYGVQILPANARPAWLATARKALESLPEAPFYARIDGLVDAQHTFHINEIELIEPALYLSTAPHALAHLAAAIQKRFPPPRKSV